MSRTNKQTKPKNCFWEKKRNFVIILKHINALSSDDKKDAHMSQLKSEPSDKCGKRLPRKTMF